MPSKHLRIDGGPHAHIPEVQLSNLFGGEIESGIRNQLFPEGKAGQVAAVVGEAICPVVAFKLFVRELRNSAKFFTCLGIGWSAEDHSVVENYCAQSQFALLS